MKSKIFLITSPRSASEFQQHHLNQIYTVPQWQLSLRNSLILEVGKILVLDKTWVFSGVRILEDRFSIAGPGQNLGRKHLEF